MLILKHIKEFCIIIFISFIGEILHYIIPLPVPASIYGLVIMLVCLGTKFIKLDDVKETSVFLIEIMPMMFIPVAVGLMTSWDTIRPNIIPYAVITVISLIAVVGISGWSAQFVIRRSKKDE